MTAALHIRQLADFLLTDVPPEEVPVRQADRATNICVGMRIQESENGSHSRFKSVMTMEDTESDGY